MAAQTAQGASFMGEFSDGVVYALSAGKKKEKLNSKKPIFRL